VNAKVYFMPATANDPVDVMHRKLMELYEAAQLGGCFSAKDLVAIKIHFGEEDNVTHLPAAYLPPLIAAIRQKGAEPFFTETCVLYRSQRANAVSHLHLAEQHGFGQHQLGIPIIIADGLRGNSEIEVTIPGKFFKTVAIAAEALMANAMLVISHVTGHMASGIGAAIKNLGMGLASRKGKLRQHSSMKPRIEITRCTGCGDCILWCPEDAISMNGNVAVINEKICIGCGECLTVCRFDAVRYNWKTSSDSLQRKMAEHALGAVIHKREKVAYLNFLINITKDCDCLSGKQSPVVKDIGVLASKDPVAIDTASLDLIARYAGKSLTALSYPNIDPTIQLQHGQEVGLGTMNYELISLATPSDENR